MELLAQINERIRGKKQIALLIDPEEHSVVSAKALAKAADEAKVDCILVGGSYVSTDLTAVVSAIKGTTNPAMAICVALKPIFIAEAFAMEAAANAASATGGVRSAMMPK